MYTNDLYKIKTLIKQWFSRCDARSTSPAWELEGLTPGSVRISGDRAALPRAIASLSLAWSGFQTPGLFLGVPQVILVISQDQNHYCQINLLFTYTP